MRMSKKEQREQHQQQRQAQNNNSNSPADNCGPMIGGNNSTHEMYKKSQRMLNKLYHWVQVKNPNFNPTKTIAVLFSKEIKTHTRIFKNGREIY